MLGMMGFTPQEILAMPVKWGVFLVRTWAEREQAMTQVTGHAGPKV